jgi:xanthine dehydrogenase accessory factor
MSTKSILDAFEAWKSDGQPLVMVTVYATEGSTYSKTGHRILIAANGDYQGLVSGGCLEGDIAEHARAVLDKGAALAVTYDLRDEADEIWGMGIGCNGVIKVLLQRLTPDSGYEPFQTIARCHRDQYAAISATIVTSENPDLSAGATLIDWGNEYSVSEIPDTLRDTIRKQCARRIASSVPELVEHDLSEGSCLVLYSPIIPIPRLLVLGAGPDAVPLVSMAIELGWQVTIADHRAAYLEEPAFKTAYAIAGIDPMQLDRTLDLNEFSAVVVMSHHLETDRCYLNQLARSKIPYIGVLGPEARRDRLVSELDLDAPDFAARLKGPVGLEIGADSPESIALSILAEIHQVITGQSN